MFLVPCCDVHYNFHMKTMFGWSLPPIVSYLRYLCLFEYSGVQHILCCVLLWYVFVLCLVCPMLPVSLHCPFLCALCCQFLYIVHSCVPYVASFSTLSILDCPMLPVSLHCPFLCALCCQFLYIVHSCVPYVASFSTLSILVCPMLPVSLHCPFLIASFI